VLDSTSS